MIWKTTTPQESYLLGFIYADGCITKSQYYVKGNSDKVVTLSGISISLSEVDTEYLQNICDYFNKLLNKKYILHYMPNAKANKLCICNTGLAMSLVDAGVHLNKSLENTSEVFDKIPNDLKKYFILGFWDGDGYVSKSGSKDHKNRTGCVSLNNRLLEAFVTYINSIFGKSFCKVIIDKGYARINLKTNKAKVFLDWLYSDIAVLDFVMERKYNEYLLFTVGEKAHKGLQNHRTKGIFCEASKKYYITASEAAIGEFGDKKYTTAISTNIRRGCRCKGKKFRYLTEEELQEIKDGNIII